MSGFTPDDSGKKASNYEYTGNFPVPKGGSRRARISLIVDLGTQTREPLYKESDAPNAKIVDEDAPGAFRVDQDPCQQVVVYADLVNDVVDYGGKIGEQQYRLMLNKSFMGKINGINFFLTRPRDAKGNVIKEKPKCLHPANPLTKLAKVTGNEEVITSGDISQLLNGAFMAQVEVKQTEDKNGKKDKEGNTLVYKNVNFKGSAEVPTDENDEPMKIAALTQKARCVTFKNATKEDIQFIRSPVLKLIKEALNYEGSAMQKAVEAWEADQAANSSDDGGSEQQEAQKEEKPKANVKAKAKKVVEDDDDDDIPF